MNVCDAPFYRRPRPGLVAVAALGAVAWAAFTPITFASREETFEIPKGTWARRMAGDKVEILPSRSLSDARHPGRIAAEESG